MPKLEDIPCMPGQPRARVSRQKERFPTLGASMTPVGPVEASRELCTDIKAINGRHCRRCGKPLSGRQKDFCGFGPGSCHNLYYSEARRSGCKRMMPENPRRDRLLFGKHMVCGDRLDALVQAAKRIMTDAGNM